MRWILFACSAVLACAQGTEPKPKVEDYEAHTRDGAVSLGAEYMVHSFSEGSQAYLIDGFLVVEVALYPPKGEGVRSNAGTFALRVNGRKPLPAAAPSVAARSLQRGAGWNQGRRMEGGVGVGGVDIGMGRPNPRYPDGRPVPPVRPPRAPDSSPGGVEREPPAADELLIRTALPEGEFKGPVSGFLYFPYTGKVSSVRTVELLYGETVLKLK